MVPFSFSVFSEFCIQRWTAEVSCPTATQLARRSAACASREVQGIWDVYRKELEAVPPDLVLALRCAFDRSCVDDFWMVWSAGAEAGLLRAYQRAGGRVSSGLQAFNLAR